MAKAGRKSKQALENANRKASTDADGAPQAGARNGAQGDSVSAYFRQVFKANPAWLKNRSNAAVLDQWLSDHPGHSEVPLKIRQNLANIKSVLRKKLRMRKKPGRKPKAEAPAAEVVVVAVPEVSVPNALEMLEESIDNCLTVARNLAPEELENVIKLLRRARNEVVWKLGQ